MAILYQPIRKPPTTPALRRQHLLGKHDQNPFQQTRLHTFEYWQTFAIIPQSHLWAFLKAKGYLGFVWVQSVPPIKKYMKFSEFVPCNYGRDGFALIRTLEESDYTCIRKCNLFGTVYIEEPCVGKVIFSYEKDVVNGRI